MSIEAPQQAKQPVSWGVGVLKVSWGAGVLDGLQLGAQHAKQLVSRTDSPMWAVRDRLNPRAEPAADAGAYGPLPYIDPTLASGPDPQPSGMSGRMWKVQHLCRVPQAKHAHERLTVRAAKSVSPLCRSRFSDSPTSRWGSPACRPARIQEAREGPMVKSDGSPIEIKSTMPRVERLLRRDSGIAEKPHSYPSGADTGPHRGTDRVGHGAGLQLHKNRPGRSRP